VSGAYSLRGRLLALALGVVAVGWAAVAGLAFSSAHREADRMFDAQLRQVADTLAALVAGGEARHVAHELEEHADRYDLPLIYQVWRVRKDDDEQGAAAGLLLRSPRAPESPLADTPGFSQRTERGATWRFFVRDHEDYRVIVGHDHAERYQVAVALALHLVWPILVGLPLMAAALWWGIGRALAPVGRVAGEVAGLAPDRLRRVGGDAPLPEEVAPLVAALNGLTDKVAQALDKERRFTADAAHELRTPLAALKVQAQLARRTQAQGTRERALDQVLAGVERMGRLVEQLLTLARLDPEAGREAFAPVDLAALAETVCAELAPVAVARGQILELEAGGGAVQGHRGWLEILLRNLVGNALRHTPPGSRIQVATGSAPEQAWLAVRDDGPGIPAEEREALLGRFARGAEAGEEGCGLGLSIAGRIAEVHGGRLTLGPGLGGAGLEVVVTLPAAGR
jgi:two-component system sensor histidine kinase QseC